MTRFAELIAAVILTAMLLGGCQVAESGSPYRNLDAEYVGMEACASCHADKAATYEQSQMGRSWEPATRANSAADFDNALPVYDPHLDLYYQALARGDSLFIIEYRLADGDTIHRRIERVDYIVGSGHHTNSHIMDVGGYLYQMPLTWYVQESRWDLAPGFKGPRNNMRFDRPIRTKCITCHNGMPEIVKGSYNKYDAVPHGINCERCHGPGSVHVDAMRSGRVVDVSEEIDYTIVNPAKLPVELQFSICQGCHVQGAAVPKKGMTFADFRPGMPLASVENVFWPRFADSLHQFVMASHGDRLTQSVCFRESPPEQPLTCITCHDPHVPIETFDKGRYDVACQSCHAPAEVAERHLEPVEDGCVSCHMPVSGAADIPHVTITDHFIRRPDSVITSVLADGSERARTRFVRMASLIDPDPSPKEIAQGYLTYFEEVTNHPGFLDSAAVYLRAAEERTSLEAVAAPLIRMHYLARDYQALLLTARNIAMPKDAWTAFRIGDAYLEMASGAAGLPYLERAHALAPATLQFSRRLASAYVVVGRLAEALAVLTAVLEANDRYADAYSDRGYVHLALEDFIQAEADLHVALALNPDLEAALANLASLYFNTNRHEEARPLVQRLIALNPTNLQYRRLLANLR